MKKNEENLYEWIWSNFSDTLLNKRSKVQKAYSRISSVQKEGKIVRVCVSVCACVCLCVCRKKEIQKGL